VFPDCYLCWRVLVPAGRGPRLPPICGRPTAALQLTLQVRLRHCGVDVQVEGIISIKTGGCPKLRRRRRDARAALALWIPNTVVCVVARD
jgi:hypothetical protein